MIWFYYFITIIIVFLCNQSVTDGNGGINKSCFHNEKQALLLFKASLEFYPYSRLLSTWTPAEDDDCCTWIAVTCNNKTGHVTELHLSYYYRLGGEISPSLLNLTYLNHLDLSWNLFNGTIPSFIASMTRLRYLDLSVNSFNGTIPSFIASMTRLRYLDLSGNAFNGTIPNFIGSMTQLRYLDLSWNAFNGIIPPEFGNLTNLRNLSLGTHGLTIENLDWLSNLSHLQHLQMYSISLAKQNHWVDVILSLPKLLYLRLERCDLSEVVHPYSSFLNSSSSSIEYLNLGDNNLNSSMNLGQDLSAFNLGPLFPTWIQTLKNLTYLDMSNNRISDIIPVEFWKTWPSRLTYLDLSSNNISGKAPDLTSNFGLYSRIDLSSNSFYGPVQTVPPTLVLLNLSKNKFYGGISFLCQIVDGFLSYLDLSNNSFTGPLPDCLWHFKELIVLNLEHNNLSGRLPASIGYLVQLEVLQLYNNSFSGELPLALKNCKWLSFLNLGVNKFFGNVPGWIGENLTMLYGLILRSNNFFGPIPLQVCHLKNLQILDLSINNLSGTIPTCVNNLSVMVDGRFLGHNAHLFGGNMSVSSVYVDNAMIEWQGNEREFTSNLELLTSIDLSSNNLTGHIPNELADLHELVALNLSKNDLLGEIPRKIGEMKQLLTLDLSRNNFSGVIPSSMSQMSSLNCLDVSYNKLSGRIPSSTQLQSFQASRYTGNAGLCGRPLPKSCPGDEEPHGASKSEGGDQEGTDELERWFYIGGSIGFATGFWMACGALILNRRGRHAFFHFVDFMKDWVYVKVVVFIRKFERVAYT